MTKKNHASPKSRKVEPKTLSEERVKMLDKMYFWPYLESLAQERESLCGLVKAAHCFFTPPKYRGSVERAFKVLPLQEMLGLLAGEVAQMPADKSCSQPILSALRRCRHAEAEWVCFARTLFAVPHRRKSLRYFLQSARCLMYPGRYLAHELETSIKMLEKTLDENLEGFQSFRLLQTEVRDE